MLCRELDAAALPDPTSALQICSATSRKSSFQAGKKKAKKKKLIKFLQSKDKHLRKVTFHRVPVPLVPLQQEV